MSAETKGKGALTSFVKALKWVPSGATKPGHWEIPDRDIIHAFTTQMLMLRQHGGAAGVGTTLRTVPAGMKGIVYGVLLSNLGGTTATVTLQEGITTTKIQTLLIGQDTQLIPLHFNPDGPLFAVQGGRRIRGRTGATGMLVNCHIFYWEEEQTQ